MSYDVIYWRTEGAAPPDEIWEELAAGEVPRNLDELTFDEVASAFRAEGLGEVRNGPADRRIDGVGLYAALPDGARYVHVSCPIGALTAERLEAIVRVGRRLKCRVFDPQRSMYMDDAQTPSDRVPSSALQTDLARAAERSALKLVWLERAFDAVAEARSDDVPRSPTQDRITSADDSRTWTLPDEGAPEALRALAQYAMKEGSSSFGPQHHLHYKRWASYSVVCGMLEQSVVPCRVVVTRVEGRAENQQRVRSNLVLCVLDGRVGQLTTPTSPHVEVDGRPAVRWTGIQCAFSRAQASRRTRLESPPTDLTMEVGNAGRAALGAAHAGDATPLRRWIAVMTTFANDGMAAAEVLPGERPAPHEWLDGPREWPSFECFELGAVMPIWSQRAFGAFYTEAQVVFPERGGFRLTLIDRARAPDRDVAPPFGPLR